MAELYADWTSRRADLSSAIMQPTNTCPALLLSVWLSPMDGLWRACTEYWDRFGSWSAPSSFATQKLAQEWCEKRAEDIASTYPSVQTILGGQP